jgi:hypothetical protein
LLINNELLINNLIDGFDHKENKVSKQTRESKRKMEQRMTGDRPPRIHDGRSRNE